MLGLYYLLHYIKENYIWVKRAKHFMWETFCNTHTVHFGTYLLRVWVKNVYPIFVPNFPNGTARSLWKPFFPKPNFRGSLRRRVMRRGGGKAKIRCRRSIDACKKKRKKSSGGCIGYRKRNKISSRLIGMWERRPCHRVTLRSVQEFNFVPRTRGVFLSCACRVLGGVVKPFVWFITKNSL